MKHFSFSAISRSTHFLLLFFLLLVTLPACTSEMFISRIQPAEQSIANQHWKVAVIKRFNPDLLAIERENKLAVFNKGASEAFNGAITAILDDSTFSLVHLDSLQFKASQIEEVLTPAQVQLIFQQHPHHLLLSLDHFDTFLEQEVEREENSDGTVSKTANYTLVTKSFWTLYDSTGAVIEQHVMPLAEHYKSRIVLSGLLAVGPSLSKAGPAISSLAWYGGNNYWKRFSPQAVTYKRAYYGSGKLKTAAKSMQAQDWETAIAELEPLANSGQAGAGKAAYNMAVAYEAMGNIEMAKFWANKALKRYNGLALHLLSDLERQASTASADFTKDR